MRNIIYFPALWGKTARLVKEARKADGVVIAKSDASKKYIEKTWPGTAVFTTDELLNGALRQSTKPIFIDDADMLLEALVSQVTPGKLEGISITMQKPE
jgi:hypothetical protein